MISNQSGQSVQHTAQTHKKATDVNISLNISTITMTAQVQQCDQVILKVITQNVTPKQSQGLRKCFDISQ